jgi:hypothetical protein
MLPSIPKGRPKPLQIDLSPDTKSNHYRHSYEYAHGQGRPCYVLITKEMQVTLIPTKNPVSGIGAICIPYCEGRPLCFRAFLKADQSLCKLT